MRRFPTIDEIQQHEIQTVARGAVAAETRADSMVNY
jgi:hypothetical protein